jgi:hypothetical protein
LPRKGRKRRREEEEEEEEAEGVGGRESSRIWNSDGCAELMGRPSQTGPILSPLIFL